MSRIDVLRTAVRAAIRNKCPRSAISVPAWASTYSVSQKLVREIWEAEMTKIPPGTDMGGEGK